MRFSLLFIFFAFFQVEAMKEPLYTIEAALNQYITEEPFITIKTSDNKELTYRKSTIKKSSVLKELLADAPSDCIDLSKNDYIRTKTTILNFLLLQQLFDKRLNLKKINDSVRTFKQQSHFINQNNLVQNKEDLDINNFHTLKSLFEIIKNPDSIKQLNNYQLLALFFAAEYYQIPNNILQKIAHEIHNKKLDEKMDENTQRLLRCHYRSLQTLVDLDLKPKINNRRLWAYTPLPAFGVKPVTLDLSNLHLNSLKGISSFANSIPKGERAEVEVIDLSFNNLETIDIPLTVFKKFFPHLQKIYLNNNMLKTLNYNDSPIFLDVSCNKLESLSTRVNINYSHNFLEKQIEKFKHAYIKYDREGEYFFEFLAKYKHSTLYGLSVLSVLNMPAVLTTIGTACIFFPILVYNIVRFYEYASYADGTQYTLQINTLKEQKEKFSTKPNGLSDLFQPQSTTPPKAPIVTRYSRE